MRLILLLILAWGTIVSAEVKPPSQTPPPIYKVGTTIDLCKVVLPHDATLVAWQAIHCH